MELTPLQLKQAGFTDEDISTHFQDRTLKLKSAGFTDYEINKYYGITDLSTDLEENHTPLEVKKNPLIEESNITEENAAENFKEGNIGNVDMSDFQVPKTLKDYEFLKTKDLKSQFEKANELFATDAEGRIKFIQDYASDKYPDLELDNLSEEQYKILQRKISYQHDVNTQKEVSKQLDKNWVNLNAREKFEAITKEYKGYFGISDKTKILDPELSTGPKSTYLLTHIGKIHNASPQDLSLLNFLIGGIANLESNNRNIDAYDLDSTKTGLFQIDNENARLYANMYHNIISQDQPLNAAESDIPFPSWLKRVVDHPNLLTELDSDAQKSLVLAKLMHTPNQELVKKMLSGSLNEKLDAWEEFYLKEYNPDYEKDEEGNYLRDIEGNLMPVIGEGKQKRIKELRKKILIGHNQENGFEVEGAQVAYLPSTKDDKEVGFFEGIASKGVDFLEAFYPKEVAESTIKALGGRSTDSIFNVAQTQSVFTYPFGGTLGTEGIYNMDISGMDKLQIIEEANKKYMEMSFGKQVATSIIAVLRDTPIFATGCFSVKVPAVAAGLTTGPIGAASVCGAGAFGLHSQQKTKYVNAIKAQAVEDYEQFSEMEQTKQNLIAYGKGAATGALTMGVGSLLRIPKASGGLFNKPPAHLAIPAEVATMVTVDSALHGEIPSARDFYTAAATIYGLHAINRMGTRMLDLYNLFGVRPKDFQEHVKKIPNLKEDVARGDFSWYETQQKDLQGKIYKLLENEYGHKMIEYQEPGKQLGNEVVVGGSQSQKGIVIEKGIGADGKTSEVTVELPNKEQIKVPESETIPVPKTPYFNESPTVQKYIPVKTPIPGSPQETQQLEQLKLKFQNDEIVKKSNKLELDKNAGFMNKNISIYNPKELNAIILPPSQYKTKLSQLKKSKQQELIDIDDYLNFSGDLKNPIGSRNQPLNRSFLDLFGNYRIRKYRPTFEENIIKDVKMYFPTEIEKNNHNNGMHVFQGVSEILYKINFNGINYLIIQPKWGANYVDAYGRPLESYSIHYLLRNTKNDSPGLAKSFYATATRAELRKWSKPIAIPEYVYNAAKVVFGPKSQLFFTINPTATKTPSIYFSEHIRNMGDKRVNKFNKKRIEAEAYYNYRPDTKLIKTLMPEVFSKNARFYQQNYQYNKAKSTDKHYKQSQEYEFASDTEFSTKGLEGRNIPNEPAFETVDINKFTSPHTEKLFNSAKGLDLIDIVSIYQALYKKSIKIGLDPKKSSPGTLGYFASFGSGNPKQTEIAINKELQKDPEMFLMTTAHELGHAIDFLVSDKEFAKNTTKRGNILGHLASLKGFMNDFISKEAPDNPISKSFLRQLKKNAEELAKKQEKTTDANITKEFEHLLITPKTILDIYRTTDAREKIDPEFYDAFVTLDPALKKEITRAAMKKMMHKHLAPLAEKINNRITKKYTGKDMEDANQAFAEAFENELVNRGIVSKEIVMRELKFLTQQYKPFDEKKVTKEFLKYRYSPPELIADFMMSFLLRPRYTAMNAPHTADAFLSFMDSKPEFKKAYDRVQESMNMGSGHRNMEVVNKLKKDAKEGHERIRNAALTDVTPQKWEIAHQIHGTHAIIADMARGREAINPFKTHFTPRPRWKDQQAVDMMTAIEQFRYWGSMAELYIEKLTDRVLVPLEKKGYDIDDLHPMLLMINLVKSDQRADLVSTLGLQKFNIKDEGTAKLIEQGARTPESILETLREEKPGLEEIANEFFRTREELIFPEMQRSGAYTQETLDMILNNKEYVTQSNLDAMINRIEKFGGVTGISSFLHKTKGSTGAISNVYISTIQKDLALIANARRNREKKLTMEYIRDNKEWIEQDYASPYIDTITKKKSKFPTYVEAKKEFVGYEKDRKTKRYEYPKLGQKGHPGKDYRLVQWIDKGKEKGAYVNKIIADIYTTNPGILPQARLFARPFQYLFTEINPAFWVVNMQRDIRGSAMNIPGARLLDVTGSNRNKGSLYTMGDRSMIRAYFGAIPEAWVSVFGKVQSKYWKAAFKKLGIKETDMSFVEWMLKKGVIIPKTQGYRAQLEQGRYLDPLKFKIIKDSKAKFGYKLVLPSKQGQHGYRDQNEIMFDKLIMEAYKSPRSPAWKQITYPWKIFQTISNVAIVFERTGKISGAKLMHRMMQEGKLNQSESEMLQRIVNDSGSPNFLNHGKAHNILNVILLYQNAWQRGVTRDTVNLLERPKEVGFKYAKYSLGPKMVQWLATTGVFGALFAEMFNGIEEYDQQNYLVMPIGYTKDGRVVYFRFALDETSRVLTGTMHDAIKSDNFNFMDLFINPLSLGTPGWNPVIDSAKNFLDGTFGIDDAPHDKFTKREMVDPGLWNSVKLLQDNVDEETKSLITSKYNISFEEFQKHIMADTGFEFIDENFSKARIEFLKKFYNKYSGTGFYKFKSNDVAGVSAEIGTLFGLDVSKEDINLDILDKPGVGPVLNRMIKIGKDPRSQQIIKPVEDAKRIADSVMRYVNNDIIEKMFDQPKELTQTEKKIIEAKLLDGSLVKNPLFKRKLIAKDGGSVFLQDLENVKSRAEKLLILNRINEYIKDPYKKKFLEGIKTEKQKEDKLDN